MRPRGGVKAPISLRATSGSRRPESQPSPATPSTERARAVGVEAAREAQELAQRRAPARPAVQDAPGLLEVLAVEEHPFAAHLDERHLPRREVLELGGRQERVAHGDLPVEVHERVEPEARNAGIRGPGSAFPGDEAERDALERAPSGQPHGDAGLAEERRLLREERPRLLRRELDAGRVPLLEAAADGGGERRGGAEAREERVLQVREEAPAAPHGRLGRLPDLLGRQRDLVLFRRFERELEGEGASDGLGRDHADAEAQRTLGQRVEDRQAPLGEAREHGGVHGRGGRLGEAGDRERLEPVARAPPLGGQHVAQDVARGRVHGGVEEALQDGRRGREAALGRGRVALLRERARDGRESRGEAAEALFLVRVRQDGPPARAPRVGRRRDAAAQQEVVRPARDLRPVLEVVSRRQGQRPHAQDARQGEEGLERVDGLEDHALEQERPEDRGARRAVVRGLAQGGDGRNGPPVHGRSHEDEGRDAGPGRRQEAGEALVAEGGFDVLGRQGARVCVARLSRDGGSLGPEREAGGKRGAVQDDQEPSIVGYPAPPMKAPRSHELFRLLSAAEVSALVETACEDDEVPEKIAGAVLTYQQIPLKRFSKLPEETRLAYVRRTLRDKRAEDLSLYVLSAALTRRHGALISAFLDAVKLPHEGPSLTTEGEIPQPSRTVLARGVDAVLEEWPARDVSLYLHAFAVQPDVRWPLLDAKLVEDARLALMDRSAE